jgi:hypothetical protein
MTKYTSKKLAGIKEKYDFSELDKSLRFIQSEYGPMIKEYFSILEGPIRALKGKGCPPREISNYVCNTVAHLVDGFPRGRKKVSKRVNNM